MFRFLIIAGLALALQSAVARDHSPGAPQLPDDFKLTLANIPHRSLTGQFLVYGAPRTPWRTVIPVALMNNPDFIRLDPALLAVSCERIKHALLGQLGGLDQWHGVIRLNLHPAASADEDVLVTTTRFGDGWDYRLDLPDRMESSRLVDALVNVLLLEMANRQTRDRSAEVPVWLSLGLSRQVARAADIDLVLQPPNESDSGLAVNRSNRSQNRTNTLAQAHELLSNQPPLALEKLSWPATDELTGPAGEAFRSSAQLLVFKLAHLDNGQACLRDFVSRLPGHLNWQIAFLEAFHQHFASQLELEKWWALHVENFTGRDLSQMWSSDESRLKIDEIVEFNMEASPGENQMPVRTSVTLQTIIKDWEFQRQTPVLQEKMQQLSLVRSRLAEDMALIADGYRQVLRNYLANRERSGFTRVAKGQSSPNFDLVVADAVRSLNQLDDQRNAFRPKTAPADTTAIDANSAFATH